MTRRWGALVLAVALVGCGRCGGADAIPSGAAEAGAPVAMPDTVLAVAYAPTPDATWEKVQRGVGGLAGILPSRVAGLVAGAADLDARVAEHVDRSSPAIVVVGGEARAPGWVYAARLSDERKARAVLVGDGAPFAAEGRGESEVLVPRGAPRARARVALRPPGLLLVGSDEGALSTLGAYAASELVVRPMVPTALTIDVPHRALAGTLVRSLEARWSATRAALGRRADPSDRLAAQLLAALDGSVRELAAAVADLERVQVTADVDGAQAALELRATPRSGGPSAVFVSALRPGEAPLLDRAPSAAPLTVWSRSASEARAQWARGAELALDGSELGRALTEKERVALATLVRASASARGDELVATWDRREDGAVAVVRMREGARAAVDEVTAALDTLVHAPGLAAALGLEARPSVQGGRVPGTDLVTYRVVASPREGAGRATPTSLSWGREGGDVVACLAQGTSDAHAWLAVDARNDRDPSYRALLGRLAARAQLVVLARPEPRRAEDPPAVVALGRDGAVAWGRVEIPWGVARAVEPMLTR